MIVSISVMFETRVNECAQVCERKNYAKRKVVPEVRSFESLFSSFRGCLIERCLYGADKETHFCCDADLSKALSVYFSTLHKEYIYSDKKSGKSPDHRKFIEILK